MNRTGELATSSRSARSSTKAVSYVRTGSRLRSDQRQSAHRQRKACLGLAEFLNAKVQKEFIDAGASGNRADRPGLARMLDWISTNRVDYVIVEHQDRLARNVLIDAAVRQSIEAAGATLVECEQRANSILDSLLADESAEWS
ncbi:MAG: recombinase family protein [Actinomycetota bacterium]